MIRCRSTLVLLFLVVLSTGARAQGDTAIVWGHGPALALPRDHHATFLVRSRGGDFLYVAGGTNYSVFYDDVSRARVNADGSLSAWEAAGKYPQPMGGTSVAVAGEWAVLTGGQISTEGMRNLTRIPDVHVARIDTAGRLGAWLPAPPLPAARFHHPALYHNGWVYVVGGQGEKEAEAGIFGARIGTDGRIAGWQELRPLPRPRSHHAAFVHSNYLYVVGGLDGAVGGHGAHFTDVIRAPINEDGTIGEWRIVSRAPHPYATHAAFGHNGYLYSIGGVEDGNRFVGTVWRAPIRANDAVGEWKEIAPLPLARGHVHNTPILNGRLYSTGGRIGNPAPGALPVTGETHIGRFTEPALDVRLITDEADAVLNLIAKATSATDADWNRLFRAEGYRRLKQREASLNRAFTDSSFRAFVLDSATVRRGPELKTALDAWRTVDMSEAAKLAFAYLPANAAIRATIYPSIKPRTNTFVFEPRTNPAIFFYLDPAMTAAQFRNTLAHELHHLGVGSVCKESSDDVLGWLGGFAEGRAVLAAAGDVNTHPHASSSAEERAVWDRDFAKVADDIKRLDAFFLDVSRGRLSTEERNRRGFEFVSTDNVPQGAYYTVGYLMASTVERVFGRDRLIASLCDPRMFMRDYDQAAQKLGQPRFSRNLLERLR